MILSGHQARLFVRGHSRKHYRLYGIPLTKADLGSLGLVRVPKGQQVLLSPLGHGQQGLKVVIGEDSTEQQLRTRFERQLVMDVKLWLHVDADDLDDPMWYNALMAMLKLLVLESIYQVNVCHQEDLLIAERQLADRLLVTDGVELDPHLSVCELLQMLMKLEPLMLTQLIKSVSLKRDVGIQYPTLHWLYQSMMNEYYTLTAMALSDKTLPGLVKMLSALNRQTATLKAQIKKVYTI